MGQIGQPFFYKYTTWWWCSQWRDIQGAQSKNRGHSVLHPAHDQGRLHCTQKTEHNTQKTVHNTQNTMYDAIHKTQNT